MPQPAAPDVTLEARLKAWLREEQQIEDGRRLVRVDDTTILISKFEPGFAPQLHSLLDELPELFDDAHVQHAYATSASEGSATLLRVDVWDLGMRALLATLGADRGIEDARQALVRVGIDSVRAVIDTALWSAPRTGDEYEPSSGELTAYREAIASLDPEHDLFTRHYGTFEARSVVNHCPGAPFARTMLAQAWTACTGTPPPA
jgi:hypothetical protein